MYRNCIFCLADLGRNDSLPSFPAGRQIAVDAWKGRLWVVCDACGRWNLVPIEERWEPVEEAEEAFRNTKTRVQIENVGLARLADGTRLIRIGDAVEGEIAAWRYSLQLKRRRHRFFAAASAIAIGGLAVAGFGAMGLVAAPLMVQGGVVLLDRRAQQIVDRIPTSGSSGKDLIVRRWHVEGINLTLNQDGVELHVRDAHKTRNWSTLAGQVSRRSKDIVVVQGQKAMDMLARALVYVNTRGATDDQVASAAQTIVDSGSSAMLLRTVAEEGVSLGGRAGVVPNEASRNLALAMEMAAHENTERLALMGELESLRASWSEAEEIAAIADALPFGLSRLQR